MHGLDSFETDTDGTSCIVTAGEAWENLPELSSDPEA